MIKCPVLSNYEKAESFDSALLFAVNVIFAFGMAGNSEPLSL